MEIVDQPKLLFEGVDIVHLTFDADRPFETEEEIEISISPRLHVQKEAPLGFQILMEVNLEVEGFFQLNLTAIGHFRIGGKEVEEQHRDLFMNANAPAIMFPYVRAFISSFTSQVGTSIRPVIVPTQFFKGPLERITYEDE
ncbi:MAG TPA: hypothetical protein ENJ82_11125 [Bacteroidetes bacterium]|nr:hypothetical protein [Bacteroidota bacterium]